MPKYIPVDKMSKKERREYYSSKRGSWGDINPVTRKPDNPLAYNRKQMKREEY